MIATLLAVSELTRDIEPHELAHRVPEEPVEVAVGELDVPRVVADHEPILGSRCHVDVATLCGKR